MIKKIILWILIISCMGVIFSFSAEKSTESKKSSSRVVDTVIKIIDADKKLDENELEDLRETLTFIVRKGAHFTIYAILGVLILLLALEYNIKGKISMAISVVISMLYACSDELHQTFVSGRSGELRDVILDTIGAITGCAVVLLISKIRRKRNGLQKNL